MSRSLRSISLSTGATFFASVRSLSVRALEGEYALDLLMIAKYYERIGDHATNIAEWVIYSVTGVHTGEITLT